MARSGIADLGLSGEVDHQDLTALYSHFIDPRDDRFRSPEHWEHAARLGRPPRRFQDRRRGVERCPGGRTACDTGEATADPDRRSGMRHDPLSPSSTRRTRCRSRSPSCTPRSRLRRSRPSRRRRRRGRRLGRAPASRRGGDLGRQQRGAEGLPGQGRLLPRRLPHRRRPAAGSSPSVRGGLVLPARQPRPRPAAAHPQRDPQPRPGHRRPVADARLPRPARRRREVAAIAERTTEEHLTRTLGLDVRHPSRRQVAGDPRRSAGRDRPVLPPTPSDHCEGRRAGRRLPTAVRP